MYNDKTTVALKVIIKFCYFALAVAGVVLFELQFAGAHGTKLIEGVEEKYFTVLYTFLFSLSAGYVALAFIDKLLTVVRKNEVFEIKTTKYLDKISYCCVYASLVAFASVIASSVLRIDTYVFLFSMLLLAELFMAMLLKVIKKIFAKAIELKEENDLTI
ncbi:DUF2975 domain-containing protein [uncultured Eubacterium sp.]|uniref:DUF2975 domain-containing protein n=1 Tax=uncultured Eubacterium sp. TaxID=165185 RepID=UPI0025E9AF5A|nr:DUF2975 domain-containing protein [uncultured Eubacterium sp.]